MTIIDPRFSLSLCAGDDVPEGSALKVETADLVLAVFHLGTKFYVTDDACTHGPGSLSEGTIDGDCIECDFHNGVFHIPTGRVEAPPCMVALNTYDAALIEGRVCIDPMPRNVDRCAASASAT